MNANRIIGGSILLGALICAAMPSHASGPFNVTGTTVLTETGEGVRLHNGDNPIDQPTQMDCVSAAGCSIVIQSRMFFEASRHIDQISVWCTRSFVDGVEANPKCKKDSVQGSETDPALQTIDVAQGSHTVQTGLYCQSGFIDLKYGGRLYRWTIIYTMYDH
jgi:hypothetical protein